MIKYCLNKWDKNKDLLKKELLAQLRNGQLTNCNYSHLMKTVIHCILNDNIDNIDDIDSEWDEKNFTVIDNGDYQGTLLFLIPQDTYEPDVTEYLMTFIDYGSCSGCDTLLAIQSEIDFGYEDKNEELVVSDFMKICKDLITNMIKPYNTGWRQSEEFNTIEF